MAGMVRPWAWEIAAMMSSIACLVAIAILLARLDQQPVFTFHGVSLNAIIAVLSTFSKTTLLFVLSATIGQWKWILFARRSRLLIDAQIIDEASRGPLGSLWMIWRMRSSIFATLGALCTVLTLASDPFTQQLIQYRNSASPVTNTYGTLPRAQRFSKAHGGNKPLASYMNITEGYNNYNGSSSVFDDSIVADASVQSAAFGALTFSRDTITQQLPFTCKSGNCTFSMFQSLAVCNRCIDVSDKIESSFDDIPMGPLLDPSAPSLIRANGTRFTLPNGLYLSNPDYERSTYKQMPALMTILSTGNSSKTTVSQDLDTLLWSVTMIKALENDTTNYLWPNVPLQALECALYYCVNDYTSKIVNGLLSEQVTLNTTAKRLADSWQPITGTNSSASTTRYDWDGLESLLPSLEYNAWLSLIERTDLSLGDNFNISQTAVNSISKFFQSFMMITWSPSSYYPFNGYYITTDDFPAYKPPAMQSLFESVDLVTTFDNLALSLTNVIRSGSDNVTVQTGIVERMETKFVVEWPWIVLHCTVAVLGLLELIAAIWLTSAYRVPVWKSYFLPVMAWGRQLDTYATRQWTAKDFVGLGWSQTAEYHYSVPAGDKFSMVPA